MGTDTKNLIGTTLSGRYKIEKPIGEGGMGAIFQATQLSLGRLVAIKVVKSIHADESDAMRRFERETEVIARLAHPNIVQVVDAGRSEDGTMFLAMELLEGDNVRGLLRKVGSLPVARVLAIIEDVASALSAAHAGGVIHRDLKAENVMLVRAAGKQEIAKVLDFGVAKLTSKTEAPPQTGSGFVAGTPGCIAPEQMLGKSDEPRSDLYSVGVLMFEMLSGTAPFTSESAVELMMRHLTEPAPRVADVARARGRGDVPQPVDDLVASLLSKDPDGRPASAEALVDIIVSLRDAGRATQGDLRMMTPQGGFAVPTPSSMSMAPHMTGTPQVALHVPTAPTTTMPMPVAVSAVRSGHPPFRRVAPLLAALVTVIVLLCVGAMSVSKYWSDRAIPGIPFLVRDQWEKWNEIDEAYLTLDLKKVRENATWLLEDKQLDVPMAHLYLAQVAMLEREPLRNVDAHLQAAKESAARRSTMRLSRTHTELLAEALVEIDPAKARQAWLRHIAEGGCTDADVEQHMFAVKLAHLEVDGAKKRDLFLEVQSDEKRMRPVGKLGYAAGLRQLGDFENARRILVELEAADPRNLVIRDALVDLDLMEGKSKDAENRLLITLRVDHVPSQLRLANIQSRREPKAFDGLLPRFRSLVDGNPMKSGVLGWIGHQHASRGRFLEADALWQESVAAAGTDDTRIAEIAVFASMFSAIAGDVVLAKKWLEVYTDHRDGIPEGTTPGRRMKAFQLANRIMIAMYLKIPMTDQRVQQDYQRFMREPMDVSLLASIIAWHALVQEDKLAEAIAAAQALPPCFRDAHVGMALSLKKDLAGADRALAAATTPAMEAFCTSTDDVVPFIQSMQFAKAILFRANVAMRNNDKETAQQALKQFRTFWPEASAPPSSSQAEWQLAVSRVEQFLAGRPADESFSSAARP